MPKYLNSNNFDVSLEGCVVAAGKVHVTTTNIPSSQLPSGVSKTSDAPYWNPMVVSEIVTGGIGDSTSISIPDTYRGKDLLDFYLKLRCTAGSVSIMFNSATEADFGAPIVLGSGNSDDVISWLIMTRDVISVDITFLEASSKLKVDVSTAKIV